MFDENDNCDVLGSISSELAKQGQLKEAASAIQEALASASGIRQEYSKSSALESISVELAKQSQFEEALIYAKGISIENVKSSALSAISSELVLQGKLEEALTCARSISDEYYKCDALGFISGELAKQGNWQLAESIGLEILLLNKRHDYWKNLGWNSYEDNGWQKALEQINQLKNEEARLFYLKGWADSVTVSDATIELVTEALPYFVNDTESIEKILQQHALHEVVFNAAPADKIKQLNSTLNIQWFLDIHNSFPQSPTATRLSTNLDTWLHEIEDEDDQDQITLWAKQVVKGKITEEEFLIKIKDI
jgi:tetratricopeptide (TPR) repeat protein